MTFSASYFLGDEITAGAAALRLFLGFVAGGIIGAERESRRQAAGLRTHVLICVGATLLMMLSIYVPQRYFDLKNGDPGRIAAQVVSGIGFLGAGAILKLGNTIKGLTTAASIWVAAAIGLALGAGLFAPAFIALGIILFALVILDAVEKRIFPAERIKVMCLYFASSSVDTKKIRKVLAAFGIKIQSVDVIQAIHKERVEVHVLGNIPTTLDIPLLYKELRALPNIYKIMMDEKI
jgi:putative Mg2+ transporter-C (MgtC) family protein